MSIMDNNWGIAHEFHFYRHQHVLSTFYFDFITLFSSFYSPLFVRSVYGRPRKKTDITQVKLRTH